MLVYTINLANTVDNDKIIWKKKIKRHRPHRSFRHKSKKWSCCLYYVGLCKIVLLWEDDHFCLIISHINIIYLFSIHLSSELCSLLLTRISHTSCHWCPVSSRLPNFVYLLIFYSSLFFLKAWQASWRKLSPAVRKQKAKEAAMIKGRGQRDKGKKSY